MHRDIKPENVLVDTRGQVKLADFGMAKVSSQDDVAAARLTRSTAVFGTPHYMAPEQWRGTGAVDHRADIFSLGVVLYEMLTGQLPIGHFDPPSKRREGVPSGLDQVVQRTLAQQPEGRYQSAREVQTDVELHGRDGERRGRVRSFDKQRAPRAKNRLSAIARVIIGVGIVIGVGGWILGRNLDARRELVTRELAKYDHHASQVLEAVGSLPSYDLDLVEFPRLPLLPVEAGAAAEFFEIYGIRVSIVLVAVGFLLALAGSLFAWQTSVGIRLLGTIVLGATCLGVICLGTFFGLQHDRDAGRGASIVTPGMTRPSDLVGRAREFVLQRLGPPIGIGVSGTGTYNWAYEGPNGDPVERALTFSLGEVVAGTSEAALLLPRPFPADGLHPGMTLKDALPVLGPPADHVSGSLVTTYRFPNGVSLTEHGGLIVGVLRDDH